jgi:hypothetical protein
MEARNKVGRRVSLLLECSGIPRGTTGEVIRIDQVEPMQFDVVVEWYLPARPAAWFSKKEYEELLLEE